MDVCDECKTCLVPMVVWVPKQEENPWAKVGVKHAEFAIDSEWPATAEDYKKLLVAAIQQQTERQADKSTSCKFNVLQNFLQSPTPVQTALFTAQDFNQWRSRCRQPRVCKEVLIKDHGFQVVEIPVRVSI